MIRTRDVMPPSNEQAKDKQCESRDNESEIGTGAIKKSPIRLFQLVPHQVTLSNCAMHCILDGHLDVSQVFPTRPLTSLKTKICDMQS